MMAFRSWRCGNKPSQGVFMALNGVMHVICHINPYFAYQGAKP